MDTDPENIVPTATNRPSSLTAIADKLSSMATEFISAPFSELHSCKNPVWNFRTIIEFQLKMLKEQVKASTYLLANFS